MALKDYSELLEICEKPWNAIDDPEDASRAELEAAMTEFFDALNEFDPERFPYEDDEEDTPEN
ncbi:MAG: hypothetical protein QOF02_3174 [Blastocatellia bacterium]|nr:hypothetical protein [Blastocatellia bacterium]